MSPGFVSVSSTCNLAILAPQFTGTAVQETNYWLRLLAASEIAPEAKLKDLLDESHQLIAILTSIIKSTRKNME